MTESSPTKQNNNKRNINAVVSATSDFLEVFFQIINTFETKTIDQINYLSYAVSKHWSSLEYHRTIHKTRPSQNGHSLPLSFPSTPPLS